MGFESETLANLNPELRYKSTPDQEYQLKVPGIAREKALSSINSLPRWIPPEATYSTHRVRRGETVSGIASRYGTSISAISRLNRLGRGYLIRPGQRLRVPSRGSSRSYASTRMLNLTKEGDKLVYNVKRGDSLYLIANAFKTTVHTIQTQNKLKSTVLRIGQKLVIQSGIPANSTLYVVKSGDTPAKIANRFGMNLNILLNLNGLDSRSIIYPGQKLRVTSNQ